jgi:uncharacterized phage-like protein YoqJ
MKIGISGHRPPRLGLSYTKKDEEKLEEFFIQEFTNYFNKNPGDYELNSGGAQGTDQAAAIAFQSLGLPYNLLLPFNGMDAKWPSEAQKKFSDLLDNAKTVRYICQDGYAAWKFLKRDEAIVDNSDLMFFLLDNKPEKSGTRHTFDYCIKQEIKYINLWPEFIREI